MLLQSAILSRLRWYSIFWTIAAWVGPVFAGLSGIKHFSEPKDIEGIVVSVIIAITQTILAMGTEIQVPKEKRYVFSIVLGLLTLICLWFSFSDYVPPILVVRC
jgi:hypothetical protein